MAICFLFVALMVGQLLHHLSHRIHFPYTPLVTIVGVIYGVIDTIMSGAMKEEDLMHAGVYKMSMFSFQNPAPELVFLIFLPALIFESAFNSDWYIFKRQFFKIILMAGPMLIFSTFATAFVMYYALGFSSQYNNISFIGCVLFGAINSATDPVAVVALLKSLGVSKRISTLIEGESLLNDGTALVLFLVIIKFVEGEDMSATDVAAQFC